MTRETLREQFEKIEGLSLRKFACFTGVCYQYLLKASKKPIVGEAYNPEAINWAEVERVVAKKMAIKDIDWDALAKSVVVKEPISQLTDFAVGTIFNLRNDERTYAIVYKTETHVVFIADNETQPRIMNNDTFMHQGPRTVKE